MSDQQPKTTMETRDCPKCGFYKSHGLDVGSQCRRVGCDGTVEATTWAPAPAPTSDEPSFGEWVQSLLLHRPEGTPWNDRGFDEFPEFQTAYGHKLRVSESSAASDAYLWLRAEREKEVGEALGWKSDEAAESAHVHIQADQAAKFAVTILAAVWNHYQGHPSIGEDAEENE